MKILIVDDEVELLESTSLLLQEIGHETFTTKDPTQVLRLLHEHHPDLVLQDVRMPGLNLDQYLLDLREDPEVGATPVLLCSATLELPDIHDRVHTEGAIEKPFTVEALCAAMDAAVAKTGERQAGRRTSGTMH